MTKESRDMLIAMILGLVIIISMCVGIFFLLGSFKGEYYGYKKYEFGQYKIMYQKDWTPNNIKEEDEAKTHIFFNANISTTSEDEGTYGLNVLIHPIELNDEIPDLSKFVDKFKEDSSKNLNKFVIIKEDEGTLLDVPSKNLVYEFEEKDNSLKIKQLFAIKDGKLYSISYEMPSKKYGQFLAIADKMVQSFDVKE